MGLETQIQELEEQLLSMPRIFVDNDALVFFDVNNHGNKEPISVAEIKGKPTKKLYGQEYNYLVDEKEICYFRTDGYEDHFETVSVTNPCIVFCAYATDENGRIKSSGVYHAASMPFFDVIREFLIARSGVYHAASMPPSEEFQKRLYKLIDTVKSGSDGRITVKAAGSDAAENYLQEIRDDLTELLAARDIKIEPEHLLLGGGLVNRLTEFHRITEFHPQTGQLITYLSNSNQKTVL